MWSLETSCGFESDKISHLVVPYMQGKGLDVGCGKRKVWPSAIGIDSLKDYASMRPGSVDIVGVGDDLSMFADNSMDYVYSSHLLEHFYYEDTYDVLAEWARVIKPGGHLILYVPSENLYPKVGEPGANPDHKWNVSAGAIENILQKTTSCGWTQLECEERSRFDEYSFFEVYQKRADGKFVKDVWQRNPKGLKRCLVIRYGAIGDAIMTASVLPELKKQGYYVTMMCKPSTKVVLDNNPHIDEWCVQDTDFVPNEQLGAYWHSLQIEARWDKIVNLCESIEGGLLAIPGRIQHSYSQDVRQKLLGVNYLERTHDIAGVPYNFDARFYPTDEERLEASKEMLSCNGHPVIIWALCGTSYHKVYPFVDTVLKWLLEKTPAIVYLYGGNGMEKTLEQGVVAALKKQGVDTTNLRPVCGEWNLRKSLTFAQFADCVVGPETGTLNAVGFEEVPKVIYLSHSSAENLTKYWKNATVLSPEKSLCPCYPCHQMHYDWQHCNQVESTGAALCASAIQPQQIFKAIAKCLGAELIEAA